MFSSVQVLSWDNHILFAVHQSSSPNWNMIARTLICWKTVHMEWWIISSCLPVPTHTKRMCQLSFGFTESGFTTLVSKESAKLKAHSLKYSFNSLQALSCHVMLWIFLFHNPSKQNRTIHPLICQNIHMSWWQISIMEEMSFHMMPKKEMFKWRNFSKQFKLFWANICAHQETKHPFCFSAIRYKQQKKWRTYANSKPPPTPFFPLMFVNCLQQCPTYTEQNCWLLSKMRLMAQQRKS